MSGLSFIYSTIVSDRRAEVFLPYKFKNEKVINVVDLQVDRVT